MESCIRSVRAYERESGFVMPWPETAFGLSAVAQAGIKGEICPYLNKDSYTMKPVMISQDHSEHSTDEKGILLPSPGVEVSTAPLTGSLKSLGPVKVETASQTSFEPLWDHLVKQLHRPSYYKS